jgi:choline dehydrogenase-like flavoprotein
MTNIAHESGGAVFGKVVDQKGKLKKYQNLRVMDASLIPTGLKTYPTLTLLCLLNYLIAKRS